MTGGCWAEPGMASWFVALARERLFSRSVPRVEQSQLLPNPPADIPPNPTIAPAATLRQVQVPRPRTEHTSQH